MNTDIYIGIDMGSTGLKAVAFEAGNGTSLAVAGDALPHIRLPGGGCELAGTAIREALQQALRSVSQQLGPRCTQVRALACTGHGAGLYLLDAHGALLRDRAVASTDQRAAARARHLAQQQGAALFEDVGCQPWAGQPTMVAAELRARGELAPGAARHLLFAKDYLAWLLTGEIASDASDASTAGLLSLADGRWSPQAFEAAGVADLAAATLPRLVPGGQVIGTLQPRQAEACGLPPGLPVAASTIDLLASLEAVGAPRRGQAVAVLGTWCVNAVVAETRDPKPAVGAIVTHGPGPTRLYLENSPSGMANIAWLARALRFPSAATVVEAAMTVPLGAHGLRFAPFINGGGGPPGASAGFIGLASHHGPAEMARAVVDAVVALHARHLGRLASFGLGAPRSVAALGGGARDVRLVELLASMLGHPVERCGDDETGARGAALHAALSQGAAPDVLPAPRNSVDPLPDPTGTHAAWQAEFVAFVDSLAPAYARHAGAGA